MTRPPVPIAHGTPRGARMHYRRKIPLCDECRAVESARRGWKPRAPAKCGTPSGYSRHIAKGIPFPEDAGGTPCGCRAAHAERQTRYRNPRKDTAA